MTDPETQVKTTAQLRNVQLFAEVLEGALHRRQHLPGLAAFCGPSGFGKTFAAEFGANTYRAFYVRLNAAMTSTSMLRAICAEMSLTPERTRADMVVQIAAHLVTTGRPLILDEFDEILRDDMVEMVRAIHDSSNAAVVVIGEEQLPFKLRRWERFSGRLSRIVMAEPCDLRDAQQLRALYCSEGPKVEDDLLADIVNAAQGSVRRVCVNLDYCQEVATTEGLESIGAEAWAGRGFFVGNPQPRQGSLPQ